MSNSMTFLTRVCKCDCIQQKRKRKKNVAAYQRVYNSILPAKRGRELDERMTSQSSSYREAAGWWSRFPPGEDVRYTIRIHPSSTNIEGTFARVLTRGVTSKYDKVLRNKNLSCWLRSRFVWICTYISTINVEKSKLLIYIVFGGEIFFHLLVKITNSIYALLSNLRFMIL